MTQLNTIVISDCKSPEDFVRQYHTHASVPFDLEAMTGQGSSYREEFETYGLCRMDPHGSRLGRWTVWCPEGQEATEETIRERIDELGYLLPLEGEKR